MTGPAPAGRGRWRLPALIVLALTNLGLLGANLERRDLVTFGSSADGTETVTPDSSTTSVPTETTADTTSTTEAMTVPDPESVESPEVDDWPGGRGPVPDGPPEARRIDLDPAGSAVVTGSAPNWATALLVTDYVASNLGVEPSAVENQLTWHPDAAEEVQSGQVLIEQAANFGLGSSEIEADSLPTLDFVAGLLQSRPSLFVVVIGHTDDSGDPDLNAQVASSRAGAVVDYLIGAGASPGQLVVAAAGEDAPVASNETEEGRRFNRRIELQFKNFLVAPGEFG